MLLREATSETYAPQVYSLSYQSTVISITVYFAFFTFSLYHKNTKNIILLSLSDLIFASGREGIDNPFIALVARFFFVCVGAWDLSVISYWIDTLVLKTEGNTYATLLHHPFLFKGKPTQCSRGSRRPMQGGRQRAQCTRFLFGAKEASAGAESRGISQRFPFPCNKTKSTRTEVIAEPTTASRPEAFAGEDYFC